MQWTPGAASRGSVKDEDAGMEHAGIQIALDSSVRNIQHTYDRKGFHHMEERPQAVNATW